MSYRDTCPQRAVVEIYHTVKTWLPVKLDCGHVETLNWTPQIGWKMGCIACAEAATTMRRELPMSTPDVNWFHVFDSSNGLWLEDGGSWSRHYRDASEFYDYKEAVGHASRALKSKGTDYDGTIIILGDFGEVD